MRDNRPSNQEFVRRYCPGLTPAEVQRQINTLSRFKCLRNNNVGQNTNGTQNQGTNPPQSTNAGQSAGSSNNTKARQGAGPSNSTKAKQGGNSSTPVNARQGGNASTPVNAGQSGNSSKPVNARQGGNSSTPLNAGQAGSGSQGVQLQGIANRQGADPPAVVRGVDHAAVIGAIIEHVESEFHNQTIQDLGQMVQYLRRFFQVLSTARDEVPDMEGALHQLRVRMEQTFHVQVDDSEDAGKDAGGDAGGDDSSEISEEE